MEDDDVADLRIAEVIADPVHQHSLADVEGGLHGLRRDLVGLHHERLDQQRQADRQGDDDHQLDERAAPRCRPGDQFFSIPRTRSSAILACGSDSSEASGSGGASSSSVTSGSSGLRGHRGCACLGAPRLPRPRRPPRPPRLPRPPGRDSASLWATPSESTASPSAAVITSSSSIPQRRSATRARLPTRPAQVVELGSPYVAPGDHLEPLDLRRVDGKGAFDPDAERLLAHRERLPGAAAAPGDHDALEHLGSAAGALDDLEVDAHPVPGREPRHPPQLTLLDALDDRAHGLLEGGAWALAARVRPETTPDRWRTTGLRSAKARAAAE